MITPNNAHFRNIQEIVDNLSPDSVDNDYLPGLVQYDFQLENNCYPEDEMQKHIVGSYLDLTKGQMMSPESPWEDRSLARIEAR